MQYEKVGSKAQEKMSIWPDGDIVRDGVAKKDPGLELLFQGKPPIADTLKVATVRANWEEQVGWIERGNLNVLNERIKEIDDYIINKIETSDKWARGKVIYKKSKRQRDIELNLMVCPHCTDEDNPSTFGNAVDFAKHLTTHVTPKTPKELYQEKMAAEREKNKKLESELESELQSELEG